MPAIWNVQRQPDDALPKGIDCLLSLTRCFVKFFALPSSVAKGGIRLKRWR